MKVTTTGSIRQNYDALASGYESRWNKFNEVVRGWVLARFSEIREGMVLDLGCGTGAMLKIIHEKYPELKLAGVDASSQMLAQARKIVPEAVLTEGDIEEGVTGRFDVILSLNVLHHLRDPAAHLLRLKELSKSGGRIYLCDFSIDTIRIGISELWWRFFHQAHRRAFHPQKLRAMISAAGLAIKDSEILKPDSFWRLQIYELTS